MCNKCYTAKVDSDKMYTVSPRVSIKKIIPKIYRKILLKNIKYYTRKYLLKPEKGEHRNIEDVMYRRQKGKRTCKPNHIHSNNTCE